MISFGRRRLALVDSVREPRGGVQTDDPWRKHVGTNVAVAKPDYGFDGSPIRVPMLAAGAWAAGIFLVATSLRTWSLEMLPQAGGLKG